MVFELGVVGDAFPFADFGSFAEAQAEEVASVDPGGGEGGGGEVLGADLL